MSNGFNTDGMYTVPATESPEMNCLESIECTIAFDVKDWSTDRRNAWIYGIVFGWDKTSLEDFKRLFRWDDADITRMKEYHQQWKALKATLEGENK